MLPPPQAISLHGFNRHRRSVPTVYVAQVEPDPPDAGTGYGPAALRSAFGELLERRFFRYMVPPSPIHRRLDQFNSVDASRLLDALTQISAMDRRTLAEQKFASIDVLSLTRDRMVAVPRLFVALDASAERRFFEGADTTGCAVHVDPEKCLDSALCEFVERQAALAAWLGPWTVREVQPSDYTYRPLGVLRQHGSVRFFDIGQPLGAPVILSTFVASDPTDVVQFACGLACRYSLREALKKSILELIQIYGFVHDLASGTIPDPRNLASFNTPQTFLTWPFAQNLGSVEVIELAAVEPMPIARAPIIRLFAGMEIELLYYTGALNLPGELLVAGKVFSFDCFLSSMERQKNNWQNRFASAFSLEVADAANRPCPLF
jgi:YcaO cyclodehydratase, ATP-ad Mg2+-binding